MWLFIGSVNGLIVQILWVCYCSSLLVAFSSHCTFSCLVFTLFLLWKKSVMAHTHTVVLRKQTVLYRSSSCAWSLWQRNIYLYLVVFVFEVKILYLCSRTRKSGALCFCGLSVSRSYNCVLFVGICWYLILQPQLQSLNVFCISAGALWLVVLAHDLLSVFVMLLELNRICRIWCWYMFPNKQWSS